MIKFIVSYFKSPTLRIFLFSGMIFLLLLIVSVVTPALTTYLFSIDWLISLYDNSQGIIPSSLINDYPNMTYSVFCSIFYAFFIGAVITISYFIRKLIDPIPEIINKIFFGGKLKIFTKEDYFKNKEYKDFTKPEK